MGFELSKERVSVDAKEKGVWKSNPRWSGVKFKIGHSGTGARKRALSELMGDLRDKGIQPTDEEIAATMSRYVADNILLDWSGDITDNGQPIPFNTDNAYQVLLAAEPLRDWVIQVSDNLDNYLEKKVEEVEGNSEPASPGV